MTHPVPVVIYSYPVVSIVGPDSVCANAPATLSAQSADTIQLYEWTVAGNTTIGSNYSLNTSQPGVYLVQLVGESNHGCMDTTHTRWWLILCPMSSVRHPAQFAMEAQARSFPDR